MKLTLKSSQLLYIVDNVSKKSSFGGNQSWYKKSWNQKAGCGPTCAANITAYLALTREELRGLYRPTNMERSEFLKHMDDLYEYITPGIMGVNKVTMFVKGMKKFCKDREVTLNAHTLSIEERATKLRNPEELKAFLLEAFEKDAPIAFLNLSRGNETRLQDWHWITITSVEILEDKITATASDEGNERTFDLLLWYMTTKKHGGLIYLV